MTLPPRPSTQNGESRGQRMTVIVLVALIHLGAIYALLRAFDIDVLPQSARSIMAFDVSAPEPPPPPPEPDPEPEGASAPPAPKAEPVPKAAPPPKQVIKPDPPLPVAPAEGTETRSGAADAGSGSGGGGAGFGTGSGGSGSGMGGIVARRAVKIAGDIVDARDYPRRGSKARSGTSVTVYYTVGADGIPRNCRIARPSGDPEADRITCRLIEQRFRYRPATDRNGNPVPDTTGWRQSFFLGT
jgi:periplasmic protein TonB